MTGAGVKTGYGSAGLIQSNPLILNLLKDGQIGLDKPGYPATEFRMSGYERI